MSEIKKIEQNQTCEWLNCNKPAEYVSYQRTMNKLLCLCDEHSTIAIEQDWPEYLVFCPNCKCRFGVN